MSLYDFNECKKIVNDNPPPFYSLIMAAMLKADTNNLNSLRMVFPNIYQEVMDRYNAPGGKLPGDN